jgi:hypothetical protein
METTFDHSLRCFRASVLSPEALNGRPALSLAELDALCSPSRENVDEVILLCLLAARQFPSSSAALAHVPWILSTMAINFPDRLAAYIQAVAGLLDAPSDQIREHAAHLLGDWWQRGNRELFACLLKALHDPSLEVVRAALLRLRHCSGTQAIEVLEHCRRVLEEADLPEEPDALAPGDPAWTLCTHFSQMALLLAKQGLINEVALRQYFGQTKCPLAKAALPAPVRDWLTKPTGAMDELLAKYTQQELGDFQQ